MIPSTLQTYYCRLRALWNTLKHDGPRPDMYYSWPVDMNPAVASSALGLWARRVCGKGVVNVTVAEVWQAGQASQYK